MGVFFGINFALYVIYLQNTYYTTHTRARARSPAQPATFLGPRKHSPLITERNRL